MSWVNSVLMRLTWVDGLILACFALGLALVIVAMHLDGK